METFFTRRATRILIVLMAASFFLMLGASLRDAAIVDEIAHIPAGYAYDHFLDYRLNPEHPPLIKVLAAVPLQFMPLAFPLDNPFWTTAVNGEWGVGGAFLYGLKNGASAILDWARLFPMLITVGLIFFVYRWARTLYGKAWALLPAVLTALSPIILAQGHYVTTDVGAAFGAAIGLFTFARFMAQPTRGRLLIAGIGFGIAQVTKFSNAVLVPVYLIAALIFYVAGKVGEWRTETRADRRSGLRLFGQLLLIFLIGTVLIAYPLYAIFTAHYDPARQLSDTTAIIGGLAQKPCAAANAVACLAKTDIAMVKNPLTRPFAEWLLGLLMVFERVSGTNVSYFMGAVYDHGTPWYFPVVYAFKETLPALILLLTALVLGIRRALRALFKHRSRFHRFVLDHPHECAIMIFIAVYWAWSIEARLNIGVRHLLPVIPLSYILAAGALKKMAPRTAAGAQAKTIFIGALLVWLGAETAFAYPFYLSYFNELGGGTWNGYRYVTDSNYDWGQDMLALQSWMQAHPEADKLALDFFGGSNPTYYLGNRAVPWQSSDGNPADHGIHWFAISINNLQDATEPLAPGANRSANAEYAWLTAARPPEATLGGVPPPDYRVGTTIFIYHL